MRRALLLATALCLPLSALAAPIPPVTASIIALPALPTTGSWTAGQVVQNSSVAAGTTTAAGTAAFWTRATTGTGNVLGTDWIASNAVGTYGAYDYAATHPASTLYADKVGAYGLTVYAKTGTYTGNNYDCGTILKFSGASPAYATPAQPAGCRVVIVNAGTSVLTVTTTATTANNGLGFIPIPIGGTGLIYADTATDITLSVASPAAPPTSACTIFTASGTWTKPTWANTVDLKDLGGGGGGGYGGTDASASASVSGGGGGGGAGLSAALNYPASLLPATLTVTIGTGGTGGASSNIIGSIGGTTTISGTGYSLPAGGGGGGSGGRQAAQTYGGAGGGGGYAGTNANATGSGSPYTDIGGGYGSGGGQGGQAAASGGGGGGGGTDAYGNANSGGITQDGGVGGISGLGFNVGAVGTNQAAISAGINASGLAGSNVAPGSASTTANGGTPAQAGYGAGGTGGGASLPAYTPGTGGQGGNGAAEICAHP